MMNCGSTRLNLVRGWVDGMRNIPRLIIKNLSKILIIGRFISDKVSFHKHKKIDFLTP
jgi:hypothetical protein